MTVKHPTLLENPTREDVLEAAIHAFINAETNGEPWSHPIDITSRDFSVRDMAAFMTGYLGAGHIALAKTPEWTVGEILAQCKS